MRKSIFFFTFISLLFILNSCNIGDNLSISEEPQNNISDYTEFLLENPEIAKSIDQINADVSAGKTKPGSLKVSMARASATSVLITPEGPIAANEDDVIQITATAPVGANLYIWQLYKDGEATSYMKTTMDPVNSLSIDVTKDSFGNGDYSIVCSVYVMSSMGIPFMADLNSNIVTINFTIPEPVTVTVTINRTPEYTALIYYNKNDFSYSGLSAIDYPNSQGDLTEGTSYYNDTRGFAGFSMASIPAGSTILSAKVKYTTYFPEPDPAGDCTLYKGYQYYDPTTDYAVNFANEGWNTVYANMTPATNDTEMVSDSLNQNGLDDLIQAYTNNEIFKVGFRQQPGTRSRFSKSKIYIIVEYVN